MKQKLSILILILILLLSGCSQPRNPASVPSPPPEGTLLVHFIDVGQADCTLIECGDFTMLIDGGNREDGSMVVSYLENQGIDELDVVVSTHPHEDHVGGLPAVLAVYPVHAVYAPTRTYASSVYDDFLYYVDQQGLETIAPEPGSGFTTGDLTVTFLGPVMSYEDTNDTSIVLRIDYGETSFLFTGDATTTAENDMLDLGMDVDVDVLKVGHHGSDTSSSYRLLYLASPTYAVISCGRDNSYGHPHEEPMSRLEQAGCVIFRTDQMGTVLAASDGTDITFTWEFQNAEPDNAEPATENTEAQLFIGNCNSHKFHDPSCSSLPAEQNRVYFHSYEEAIAEGYSPCGNCLS